MLGLVPVLGAAGLWEVELLWSGWVANVSVLVRVKVHRERGWAESL